MMEHAPDPGFFGEDDRLEQKIIFFGMILSEKHNFKIKLRILDDPLKFWDELVFFQVYLQKMVR